MENPADLADDERLVNMLHALGNPTRLAIVRYIAAHPGCICNDLVVRFDRAQATVSQHLATLRRANVLIAEPDGPATCYWIATDEMRWMQRQIGHLGLTLP